MEYEKVLNLENLRAAMMLIGMDMDYSLSIQEEILWVVDERISKIRTDIISGTKTEDEMNVLLDELQRLAIKKRDVEAKIGSIKHMHELSKRLQEEAEIVTVSISEVHGKLKELVNKNEES